MIQKILPMHGKVAIVDNEYNEIIPMQNLLVEYGIPYIFYDYNNLQKTNIKKCKFIRILFLDIRLEDGTTGKKNILTILASTVEKIVETENGPYTIVLWTNEYALGTKVKEYLLANLSEEETTLPTYVCALDKKDFINKPKETLEEKLFEQLKEQNMMNFLAEWENSSTGISGKTIQLLLYGLKKNMDNDSIEKIMVQIASLESIADNASATYNVLQVMAELVKDRYTDLFSDEELIKNLSKYWKYDFKKQDEFKKIKEETPIEQKATINSSLNITPSGNGKENLPGKVYNISEDDLPFEIEKFRSSTLSEEWYPYDIIKYSGSEIHMKLNPIEVDITPNCDYAQGKNHMLRTVFGYKIIIEQVDIENKRKWISCKYTKKISDKIKFQYVYVTPELMINDELCVFVLNTKYMTIEPHTYSDKDNYKYLFRFNCEIMNEIRKRCGEVISRIGINNL